MSEGYWYDEPAPVSGPVCEKDGTTERDDGSEFYWSCGRPGTIEVPSGRLLCEDHAGELGYGPKQEEYGFDPADCPEGELMARAERADTEG